MQAVVLSDDRFLEIDTSTIPVVCLVDRHNHLCQLRNVDSTFLKDPVIRRKGIAFFLPDIADKERLGHEDVRSRSLVYELAVCIDDFIPNF